MGVFEGIAYSIYAYDMAADRLEEWEVEARAMVEVLLEHEADPQFIYSYIIDYFTYVTNLDPEEVRRLLNELLCL